MPVQSCQINNEPGYKWGQQGKCYSYDPTSDTSKSDAKKKAISQGVASGDLEAIGARINSIKMSAKKTSFDFDGTLSTKEGQDIFNRTIGDKYVITARNQTDSKSVYEVTDKLRIPRSRVFFTGSNQNKIKKIESLGIDIHYDNNLGVANSLKSKGRYFHP